MKIRNYAPNDCLEIITLFYETVHNINIKDYTKKQVDVWAPKTIHTKTWNISFLNNYTLVAEENEMIIGFGDIDNTGYIDRLYIHKDRQRKGIAKAILNQLEQYALSKNITTFTTHASITARLFFEKQGYHVINENKVVIDTIQLINYIMEKHI